MKLKANWYGYNVPFFNGIDVMPLQINEQLVKNDVLQLILTPKGSRVMRPTFGSLVPHFPFESADEGDIRELRRSLFEDLATERRINVKDIRIETEPDKNMTTIKILASLVNTPAKVFLIELGLSTVVEGSISVKG